jgi:hypothetical protein
MPWRRKPASHLQYWSGPLSKTKTGGFKSILVFCCGPPDLPNGYHSCCHHNGRLYLADLPNGIGAISRRTYVARNAVRSAGSIPDSIGAKSSTSTMESVHRPDRQTSSIPSPTLPRLVQGFQFPRVPCNDEAGRIVAIQTIQVTERHRSCKRACRNDDIRDGPCPLK